MLVYLELTVSQYEASGIGLAEWTGRSIDTFILAIAIMDLQVAGLHEQVNMHQVSNYTTQKHSLNSTLHYHKPLTGFKQANVKYPILVSLNNSLTHANVKLVT